MDEYGDFRTPQLGDNFSGILRSLADELQAKLSEVDEVKAKLELAKQELKDIAEVRIPEATDGVQGKFDLGDGRELQIKEEIRASIAGEKRIPAIQWMDDNDYGHIVKRQIIIEFPKGQSERCDNFLKALQEMEKTFGVLNIKSNYTVHPATLVSWVKEMLGEGVALPDTVFGIFRQRTAKIKDIS